MESIEIAEVLPVSTSTCSSCGESFEKSYKFCPNCGSTLETLARREDTLTGKTIAGKYRLIRKVGEGSMGTVYEAQHVALRKRIAFKVLHPDLYLSEDAIRRFQQEGVAAGRFTHPNAIQIFDLDKDGEGRYFLAMEFVEGRTLREILASDGPMPVDRAVDVLKQVLGALSEAHRQGIIHRDLKPDNIMILPSADDAVPAVKVLDFGMAKIKDYGENLRTQPGRIMGTPLYMSPEQSAGGAADHRSDIYAAGLILYECLTGSSAFKGKSVTEILFKQGTENPMAPSLKMPDRKLPRALDRVVLKALAKDPAERYDDAEAMLSDLLDSTGPSEPSPARTTHRHAAARPLMPSRRRSKAFVWMALLLGLAIVGAGAAYLFNRSQAGASAARLSLRPERAWSAEDRRYVELLREAERDIKERRFDEALTKLSRALDSPSKDAEAYCLKGRAFLGKSDRITAKAEFEEALRLDPTYGAPHDALGLLALEAGDFEKAGAEFQQAIRLDPKMAEPHVNLGRALLNLGDVDQAESQLQEALRLNPTLASAHHGLGTIRVKQGKLDEAVKSFTEAKRDDVRWADPREALGDLYTATGRHEEALREYQEAVDLASKRADLHVKLGLCLQSLGRQDEATKSFREGVQADGSSADAHLLLGAALAEVKDLDEAARELERAADLRPNDPRAHLALGDVLRAQNKLAVAKDRYRRALTADAQSPDAARNLGFLAFQEQDFEEARGQLETAEARGDQRAMTYFALGILYMDYFPDSKRALESFQQYRDLGGTDSRVTGWMSELRAR